MIRFIIIGALIISLLIFILWVIDAHGETQGKTEQSSKFDTGTVVTLTQTCCPGFVFAGWTGDCKFAKKNKTCTITMDGDKKVGMVCLREPKNLRISDKNILEKCKDGKTGYLTQTNIE